MPHSRILFIREVVEHRFFIFLSLYNCNRATNNGQLTLKSQTEVFSLILKYVPSDDTVLEVAPTEALRL